MKIVTKIRKMSTSYNDVPLGIRFLSKLTDKCFGLVRFRREFLYKSSVLVLTYMAYACYHMTRKPTSVVRSVLHQNCSGLLPPHPVPKNSSTWCDYAPFDGDNASTLFGALDSSFLFSYAFAMFLSGFVAERVSIRYFLTIGMIMSGLFTMLFGLAKILDIHNIWYFVFVQICAGIFQTTGWPGVIAVLGRWFGKSKRGLIFGIWNSHTSIGNILGTIIPAAYIKDDWSKCFIVPGGIMACFGVVLFLFLVERPELVCCQTHTSSRRPQNISDSDDQAECTTGSNEDHSDVDVISNLGSVNAEIVHRATERTPMINKDSTPNSVNESPISLYRALRIPGVLEFSLCLFFSKLVSYTFLYWLPLYIEKSTTFDAKFSAKVSTLFDVGGIMGAILAGMASDYSGMPAVTCCLMFFLAAPSLLIYHEYGALSVILNGALLLVSGILVNGPYALITTSVSAELGQHRMLEGNAKALATVTAIIDGTGSVGAAVGPLLAGVVSRYGWHDVFYMLITSDLVAMLLLLRLARKEIFRRNSSYIGIA